LSGGSVRRNIEWLGRRLGLKFIVIRRKEAMTAAWATKLMHSWGFALREEVFAETKEGKCKNKRGKS